MRVFSQCILCFFKLNRLSQSLHTAKSFFRTCLVTELIKEPRTVSTVFISDPHWFFNHDFFNIHFNSIHWSHRNDFLHDISTENFVCISNISHRCTQFSYALILQSSLWAGDLVSQHFKAYVTETLDRYTCARCPTVWHPCRWDYIDVIVSMCVHLPLDILQTH